MSKNLIHFLTKAQKGNRYLWILCRLQCCKKLNISECIGILPKICGCCLGDASTDANEIVECDGCGIAVHEGCYGIGPGAAFVETGSIASTVSSASTEPWFCEPCRAGLRNPPRLIFYLCSGHILFIAKLDFSGLDVFKQKVHHSAKILSTPCFKK